MNPHKVKTERMKKRPLKKLKDQPDDEVDYDVIYRGRDPKDRTLADSRANQWTGTRQQEEFLQNYLDPKSPTFANPYTSAMEAGYSEKYSRIIATPSVGSKWIKEAHNIVALRPEHVVQKLQEVALDGHEDTRNKLKALELIGKSQGMFVDRRITAHVNIEQALNDLQ